MFETDANGTIDFNQFTKIVDGDYDFDMKIFGKNLFKDLDADKDGFISFDEFKKVNDLKVNDFIPGILAQSKEDFLKADTNKDGKINQQGKFISSNTVKTCSGVLSLCLF